jgi:uncharacterized protein YndB with AHSA1/START domain
MAVARSRLAERTLTLERVFDAPVALLWRCWTEGEHLRRWSCPRGFTIPHAEGEFAVGGKWRITMRTPEGQDLAVGGEYREIAPLRRLVMTHAWDDESGKPRHWTMLTVTFEALGNRTKVTLVQTGFDSDESREGHRGGWSECFDILAEHLAALTA